MNLRGDVLPFALNPRHGMALIPDPPLTEPQSLLRVDYAWHSQLQLLLMQWCLWSSLSLLIPQPPHPPLSLLVGASEMRLSTFFFEKNKNLVTTRSTSNTTYTEKTGEDTMILL